MKEYIKKWLAANWKQVATAAVSIGDGYALHKGWISMSTAMGLATGAMMFGLHVKAIRWTFQDVAAEVIEDLKDEKKEGQ